MYIQFDAKEEEEEEEATNDQFPFSLLLLLPISKKLFPMHHLEIDKRVLLFQSKKNDAV